ncbi:hypothetical protein FHT78_004886 [Rhizobium sp. BK196]|uniref:hypothetical protein n=1 Tax=Rhizobium sp. BK196 TaxID=2587073 RepID=UPI001610D977|nr:hypothetical protein [Rhizobium sp. BK196]MBB3313098.1 hypothetical protein [Rhizobium sp. BK196]
MQKLRIAFLMSAAVIAAAELAGPAAAETIAHKSANTHVFVMRLPDGSIEQIRYAGDWPPQVRIDSQPEPGFFDPFWPSTPFADLDRISADMDREAAAMLQQADSMMLISPGNLTTIGLSDLPAGVRGYSMVSTISGNGVCTRSVRYVSTGNGKPHVESNMSGNCAPGKAASAPVPAKAPRPGVRQKPSGIIEVNAQPQVLNASQANLRLASVAN